MNKIELLKLNNKEENILYSPYSLLVALSMLSEGAKSYTKEELERILENEQIYKINNIDNIMSVLNKMYIKNDINGIINENYKNIIKEKYNADVELNDLKDVYSINKYIEDSTFGQLKNVIESISGNLLLINTLAVDMEWPYDIDASSIHRGQFNNMIASYIYGFEKYNASYYKDSEVTSLGLELKQYDNNNYECVIIQPDNIKLYDYINYMNDSKLNNILYNLKSLKDETRTVDIAVPKFSFNYNYDANNAFGRMGLNLKTPDLTNISSISDEIDIIHKTNIDFSEKGLKASAASVVQLRCGSAYNPYAEKLEITIDKPFLFLVREKNSNTILFMGTVYKPVLWENDFKNYSYEE